MNKERDYGSDTDESDEDFRPDNSAGESASAVSDNEEVEEDDGSHEESDNDSKIKTAKVKRVTKKVNEKKKKKSKRDKDESDDGGEKDDNTRTSRRSTRQRENVHKNSKEKSLEKDELVSDEEDKSRTSALWADFLKDVNPVPSSSKVKNICGVEKKQESLANEKCINGNVKVKEQQKQTNLKCEESKKIVTEVLDFAGEEVCIERVVDASSIKENKAVAIQPTKKQPFGRIMPGAGIKRTIPPSAAGSSTGLGSILNQLSKKKKLSVLEKSQMDWNNFKQAEGIDEQLQTFNKGKDGYLERQDFLQRTDLRQFEIERNLRQTTRRPL